MSCDFIPAEKRDIPVIWEILRAAIKRRKADGSNQWQDGYPNPSILEADISRKHGFILTKDSQIIGYAAVMMNDEPQYANIDGAWITKGDFIAFHRVAIATDFLGKGYAQQLILFIHDYARKMNISSIKADTNFDNTAMMGIFDKLGYSYCGGVLINGSPRRAYEKVIAANGEDDLH